MPRDSAGALDSSLGLVRNELQVGSASERNCFCVLVFYAALGKCCVNLNVLNALLPPLPHCAFKMNKI